MTTDQNAIIRAQTVAVTQLLLGNRQMKHGVIITGGDQLDFEGRTHLAQSAALAHTDVVALEFGLRDDGSLWLSRSGNRAGILPRPECRGRFRLSPRELIDIDGKPAEDPSDGVRWAAAWLARRIAARGAPVVNANFFSVAEGA